MPKEPSIEDKYVKISRDLPDVANSLVERLEEKHGENVGFCLMVFPLDEDPIDIVSYISNCERAGCMGVLKKLLNNWEQESPCIPVHMLDS